MKLVYPVPRRDESVFDDYHGHKIADPYRWLEDPDSPETEEFVEEQNSVTRPILENCPVRADVNRRLTELWNFPKYSCPYRHGDKYFFYKNTGLQNQSVLYIQDTLDSEPRVFLDPNVLSDDGTVALSRTSFSEDGKILAFGLSSSAEVSDCGQWLIITSQKDCRDNLLYFCDLNSLPDKKISGKVNLTQVVHKLEADYEYVTNEGPVCIFRTNKDAPNYRLIKIDFTDPRPENWSTLIPEHEKDVLDWASAVNNDKLVVCFIHDVKSVLQLHELSTGEVRKTFPLPVGTVTGYSGKKKHTEIFYQFTSFLSPGIIFHCDLTKTELEPEVFREIKVQDFEASLYETKQVFYESKDGTKIPMFIVHKAGLVKDGKRPCLLYGYGGFNVSIMPTFSVTRLVFIQHFGGILAIPNIRGGGEYGEGWHNAGRLFNKQNVFDDFQAAAEYLVKEGYTCREKLTIQGGSNGGLLVAACINQRPELYGAAIVQVGEFTPGNFPKILLYITVYHLKNPLLIRVETKAGHGGGKPTAKLVSKFSLFS
ncbi:Prolyl endopeptidase [Blattella germanica]|nr:Prolyl endopeptidase [Blattella germanica]